MGVVGPAKSRARRNEDGRMAKPKRYRMPIEKGFCRLIKVRFHKHRVRMRQIHAKKMDASFAATDIGIPPRPKEYTRAPSGV